ncbi:MAG: NPCBM/NEW2 domain-containing protein [Armatimonadota bacterium]
MPGALVGGILLLSSLLAGPAWAGDASVLLADGKTVTGVDLKPGATAEQIVLTPSEGEPLTVSVKDLVQVSFGKVAGRTITPTVRLANGDRVFGKLSFPAARQVKVSAGWGEITIPLPRVSALRLQEKAALPGPVGKDTVILANDRVQGELQGIAADKVSIDPGGGPIPVPIERVQAIALAPRAEAAAPPRTGVVLSLDLGGGDRLTGTFVKLGEQSLTVKLDWGAELELPLASLTALEVRNGKLVYVSDLEPSESRTIPYLDGAFTIRQNQSASGRPLRLRGRTYTRGLGMRSRSQVTYTLDGSFAKLVSLVGIDDEVGRGGSVVYRVFGDDKLLWESPIVRGGDAPLPVEVPLKGVLLLRLEVDYADNGDAADHADWVDTRLMRE